MHPVFSNRKLVFLLATLCCMLWGSAYPSIKAGYALFAIAADDLPSKLLFAGYRFLAAQIVALDPINPQVAARLARCFDRWRRFDTDRQRHAQAALVSVRELAGLSRDVAEVVGKALE